MVCLGNASSKAEEIEAFIIKWDVETQSVEFDLLPALKKPKNYLSGISIGNKIIVGGGFDDQNDFLSLDLSKIDSDEKWVSVKQFEGPSRMSSVLVSQSNGLDNCLFVFGGKDTDSGNYLNDCYQFNPKTNSWKKLTGIPFKSGKANSLTQNSAIPIGATDILYFNQAARKSYLYHTIMDTWENTGLFPATDKSFYFFENENNPIALSIDQKEIADPKINLYELSFTSERQEFGMLNILVLVFYFVLLIILGIYFSSKQKDSDDYFKAERRFRGGPLV